MTFKKVKSMKINENKQCMVRKWVGIVLPFYLFTFIRAVTPGAARTLGWVGIIIPSI